MISAFYAFPSTPPTLPETLLDAISIINKKSYVNITPWTELRPTGRIIITQILRKIDESDLFLYELSGLNPNVCFEIGYAIAKGKRIWGTLDFTNPNNINLVGESTVFSNIGYSNHLNHTNIVSAFQKEKPFDSIDESFLSQFDGILEAIDSGIEKKDILYLKSPQPHTASKKLTTFLKTLNRTLIEFDILENSYQPIDDLILSIATSKILIVHLLNNDQNNHMELNAVYSLAAGIGVGLGIDTLMLVPEPYRPPMDYRQILFVHSTAKECIEKVEKWIYPILSRGSFDDKAKTDEKKEIDSELSLIRFILGDGQAEHEEDDIDSFFVETSQYHVGLNEQIALFIGRKGTGKTANLYRMKSKFEESNDNFIVMIKPQSFRLESYVKLISDFFPDIDIQSQITEKIWEFIVYSSILLELYHFLKSKPQYYDFSQNEQDLIDYVEENESIIAHDFGEKIDFIFCETEKLVKENKDPRRIVNVIYDLFLREIKEKINSNLPKFKNIIILIDNLDKAWDFGKNIDLQCKIVFGLIGFHNTLIKGLNWNKRDTRFHIFLREDIFKIVSERAREPDKLLLNTTRLEWNDENLLLQVIEDRFMQFDEKLTKTKIWETLFCEKIGDTPTRSYLYNNITRRPRDLIFFVKSAINVGINHRHSVIQEDDILSAQKSYFEFLISNTVTEYKLFLPEIREILFSFYGVSGNFNIKELKSRMTHFTSINWSLDQIVEFLINISFLGIVFDGDEKYSYSDTDTNILFSRYTQQRAKYFHKNITFSINPAFYFGLRAVN
jgi:hypothetical protein